MTAEDHGNRGVVRGDVLTRDRLLVRAVRHGWGWTALLFATTGLDTAATLLLPAAFASAVDAQLGGAGSHSALLRLAAVLGVLVCCEALSQLASPASSASATAWLRRGLVDHLLALGVPARSSRADGELVSRLMIDASTAGGAAPALSRAVSSLALSLGGIVALALIDPRLALAFVAGLPVGLLIVRVFLRRAARLADDYLGTHGAVASRLLDALSGARTIRASGTLDREIERTLRPAPDLVRAGTAMWKAYGEASWQSSLLAPLLQVTVLVTAGYGMADGRLTPGQFLASLAYVGLGLAFFGQADLIMRLAWSRAGAGRLVDVHGEPPTPYGSRTLPPGPGELVLRAVRVPGGEGGPPALDRVDLTVPAGQSLAVVGRSGSGKTALAMVAGRLIDPAEGEVLLDGVPVRDLTHGSLRREVGYAFERPELTGGSVAGAIAFGAEPALRPEVVRAAELACADAFVRRLPHGYDTALADTPLSGGERQRLGLARAFAHPCRLLILDDSMSSLDTITEAQVSAAVTGALADVTRVIVAHRAGTAARADLVAWLDGGRLRGFGPHHELWNDPEYRAALVAGAE